LLPGGSVMRLMHFQIELEARFIQIEFDVDPTPLVQSATRLTSKDLTRCPDLSRYRGDERLDCGWGMPLPRDRQLTVIDDRCQRGAQYPFPAWLRDRSFEWGMWFAS